MSGADRRSIQSYLVSMLVQKFGAGPFEAFHERFPGCWLVLEPTPWRVGKSDEDTTVVEELGPVTTSRTEGLGYLLDSAQDVDYPVGRDRSCAIVVNDVSLSHTHFSLARRKGDTWTVTDAGSKNGTAVNGKKLLAHIPLPVAGGAAIRAGKIGFHFYTPQAMFKRIAVG